MSDSKGGYWTAAIAGGIVGSLLTAGLAWFALADVVGPRIVRQGMLADPQILVETANRLREQQYAPTLDAQRANIEVPFASSWKGAAKPDVTLVEFYDYACPYCKAGNPIIDRLVKEDPGLRVVYRELPVLGPESVNAARVSLAASKAGKFHQFNETLWAAGRPGPETIARAAQAAGVSPVPADDPAAEAELRKNMQIAGQLGATGTPLFVIGNQVINSAVSYEVLKDAIAAARARD